MSSMASFAAKGWVGMPRPHLPGPKRQLWHPRLYQGHRHPSRITQTSAASPQKLADLNILSYSPPAAADLEQPDAAMHIPELQNWHKDPLLMSGVEPGERLRVAVLVSGGVDSSLALALVRAVGHEVVAFYLQIWFQEDFRNFWDACPWEEDLAYAQQVCDGLGVPLEVVPLTDAYWQRVVSSSVAEIKAGRTPNPDMLCNSRVKFGAFLEYLEQQQQGRFDRIASGHYARVIRPQQHQQQQEGGQQGGSAGSEEAPAAPHSIGAPLDADEARRNSQYGATTSSSSASIGNGASSTKVSASSSSSDVLLGLTPDALKDQTYFLAHLSPQQLAKAMFPLGSFTKPQVRALASAGHLVTSSRKDSQGICFLGKVKFTEFVKEHLGEWPGPLVEAESGALLGLHQGYWFYTVGQRGGIKLPGGPWYVTAKDVRLNVVYVSRHYYEGQHRRDAFLCGPFNWLSTKRPQLEATTPETAVPAGAAGVEHTQARPTTTTATSSSSSSGYSSAEGGSSGGQDGLLRVKVRHGPTMYTCQLALGTLDEVREAAQQLQDATAGPLNPSSSSSGGALGAGTGALQADLPGPGAQGEYGLVRLSADDQGIAAGQYAVFYQDGICLGAAKILGPLSSDS